MSSHKLCRPLCPCFRLYLIIFHQGRAEYFHGGYGHFLEKVGWEGEPTTEKKEKTKINKKEARRLRALERQKERIS